MSRLELQRSRVLVTGAASGIGEAMAHELAARGADLVLVSRPEESEPLKALADELVHWHSVDVVTHGVDLTHSHAVDSIQGVCEGFEIDVLVNNAGVLSYGRFHELDVDRQLEMVHVNIEAVVRLTHAFTSPMIKRGRGWILNISSVSAFQPAANHAVYAATKAFVQSFSEALHAELGPHGIHVGTLNPPYTSTPMIAEIPRLPWNRFVPTMTPEDVAKSGVYALEKELLYHVPDWQSRIANAWAPRLFPRRFTAWLSQRMLSPSDK